ncbi:MAG: universal stress protein [Bacteroidales bacterium]|nr:universal stress protein [Salinivirgaceae bacterium]MBR7034556.1 universal stress protein [Bacteroidales bacterium]
MESGKKIIVPWDFTEVAQNALAHAAKIAKVLENDIVILHIVKEEKEISSVTPKLNEVAANAEKTYGLKVSGVALAGSIFTTIGEYTKEHDDVNLVIMGTHGMKGLQKLTGSWALKVIVSSYAPFIVVQDPPLENTTYSKIVFPVDFKNENREKLVWAIYFGKIFNAKICFIKQEVNDSNLVRKVNTNLSFAKKYLTKYEVEYEIETATSSNFEEQTIEYAKRIEADMMMIMTTKNIGTLDYVLGASEQYIIANTARIPVMCVNPRKNSNFALGSLY